LFGSAKIWDSNPVGSFNAWAITVFNINQFATSKHRALFTQYASRNLFDTHALFGRDDLDRHKLRLGFIDYGAISRRHWRTVSPEDIGCDHTELQRH
jgi:hypothetical protein